MREGLRASIVLMQYKKKKKKKANYLSLESILNESSDEEEEGYSDTFNDADSSLLNFVRMLLIYTTHSTTLLNLNVGFCFRNIKNFTWNTIIFIEFLTT